MNLRKIIIALGVGLTSFLVATVGIIEYIGGDFPSALIAIPIGLLFGLIIGASAFITLNSYSGKPIQTVAVGVAAFSYCLFFLWILRYSLATIRPILPFQNIIIISALVSIIMLGYAWVHYPIILSS